MRQLTCADIMEEGLMARYVAGQLSDAAVEALESHYLTCAGCYNELRLAVAIRDTLPDVAPIDTPRPHVLELDVGKAGEMDGAVQPAPLPSTRTRRRHKVAAIVGLASAAVLTLMVLSPIRVTDTPAPHRDDISGTASLPIPRNPVGQVIGAQEFRWLAVTGANQYRVTLYDAQGAVVWEGETSETHVALPEDTRLEPGGSYLWEVAARVDWNRWVRSSLAEFQVRER